MSGPRALTARPERRRAAARLPTAEPLAGVPRRGRARGLWWLLPLAIAAGLLGLRAALHVPPLERLAPTAREPADPPGTTARAGALAVVRGGPIYLGFVAPARARLVFGGRELVGAGLVTARFLVPRGAAAIRLAAPAGTRLVWSPVGRRGPPEYVPASSLAPAAPAGAAELAAVFPGAGRSLLDGAIALGLLVTLLATVAVIARRRLAAVARGQWLAMGGVLAVALVVRLVGLGAAGATWDEDTNWAAGRNYVTSVLDLDGSPAAWQWNYEHPPVMKLLAGIGAQLADGYGPARAISALCVAIACALLVPIGARLFGLAVGVIAALIAALLPPLIAHGQIVGHEAPSVLWWALGALLALGAHDYLPSGARGTRVLAARLAGVGVVIGIAAASRFIGGLLGLLCAAIVVAHSPAPWRRATLVWGGVLMPLCALATFYAVWPRLWLDPIGALRASLARLDVLHAPEPFLGAHTAQPGEHYFLVYLGATLPLGILAAALVGLGRAAVALRRPARAPAERVAAIVVIAWLAAPLLVSLSPVRQDGVRYVLPCLLALALLAASGLDTAARALSGARARLRRAPPAEPQVEAGPRGAAARSATEAGRRGRAQRSALALGALATAYLGVTAARTAPYYLDYFGEHVGGAGGVAARGWLETAWWGEGLDRAVAHVNARAAPGAPVYRGCILPTHLAWLREDLWAALARDPRSADWIVVYSPATRPCAVPPDAVRDFAVVHDGAELAVVYRRATAPASPPRPAPSSPRSPTAVP